MTSNTEHDNTITKETTIMTQKQLVTIPFSGFYDSWHRDVFDSYIEQDIEYFGLTRDQADQLLNLYYESDFKAMYTAYVRQYSDLFASEFELDSLSFKSLQSPREYNFSTDRVFCYIEHSDIAKMLDHVRWNDVRKLARDTFTSRDGFTSFYSPNIDDWGLIKDWDHNQLAILLQCYIEAFNNEAFDYGKECDLVTDEIDVTGMLLEHATNEFNQLFNQLTQEEVTT